MNAETGWPIFRIYRQDFVVRGDKSSFFIARESQMTIDESDSRGDLEIRAKRIFARWEWIIPMQIDREIAFLAMLEIWLISKSLSTIISIAGEIIWIRCACRKIVTRSRNNWIVHALADRTSQEQLAYVESNRRKMEGWISLILPRASSLYLSSLTRLLRCLLFENRWSGIAEK